MCGRFVQVIDIEVFVKRFGVKRPENIGMRSSYNVAPGDLACVITNDKPEELQLFRFGLTPHWAKKPMYIINARTEGDFNQDNDPGFTGTKGIINKPSFRKPVRSQRCLVLANAFIEGTTEERLSKPFAVYRKDKKPFAFAGIWDTWVNKETGEVTNSFSIITSVANELIQKIPHHRSPVILHPKDERKWLDNDLPLSEVTGLLKPFPAELMNAHPISIKIKDPKNKNKDLLIPVGEQLDPEYDIKVKTDLRLEGMGSNKRKGDPPERKQPNIK